MDDVDKARRRIGCLRLLGDIGGEGKSWRGAEDDATN